MTKLWAFYYFVKKCSSTICKKTGMIDDIKADLSEFFILTKQSLKKKLIDSLL